MPYEMTKVDGYKVTSPHGVKSKGTTKENAEAQIRLLHGVEYGMKPRRRMKGSRRRH